MTTLDKIFEGPIEQFKVNAPGPDLYSVSLIFSDNHVSEMNTSPAAVLHGPEVIDAAWWVGHRELLDWQWTACAAFASASESCPGC